VLSIAILGSNSAWDNGNKDWSGTSVSAVIEHLPLTPCGRSLLDPKFDYGRALPEQGRHRSEPARQLKVQVDVPPLGGESIRLGGCPPIEQSTKEATKMNIPIPAETPDPNIDNPTLPPTEPEPIPEKEPPEHQPPPVEEPPTTMPPVIVSPSRNA
jgi:hypothetical protein